MGKNKKKSKNAATEASKTNVETPKETTATAPPVPPKKAAERDFSTYRPGFLSAMLSSKNIDSKPDFDEGDEIAVNSEDEKKWSPFEEEDLDEDVSKAFEELQKNPDVWMKKMEKEMDDSDSEESENEKSESANDDNEESENEESESDNDDNEENESEHENEMEEDDTQKEENNEEQNASESASDEEESEPEPSVNEKAAKKQQKREQLKEQKKEEKKAVKAINPDLSIFVKNISFDYQEESFRNLFKDCGVISMLFMVQRNDGRFAGYGAVEFKTKKGLEAALNLDGTNYLGRAISVSKLEDPTVLDRQNRRKEKKMEKKEKKVVQKKEKKEKKGKK